jgi:hypothetical protein
MSILDAARQRRDDAPPPRRIDYDRMNRVHPRQKAALTRAIKTHDAETIARVCKTAIVEWNAIGAWPDDWHRWQNALDNALGWNDGIDIRDL